MYTEKCCGECKYSKYNYDDGEYECTCEESDMYGLMNSYTDICEEFCTRE